MPLFIMFFLCDNVFYGYEECIRFFKETMGKDYTLFALTDGVVKFETYRRDRKQVSVYAE